MLTKKKKKTNEFRVHLHLEVQRKSSNSLPKALGGSQMVEKRKVSIFIACIGNREMCFASLGSFKTKLQIPQYLAQWEEEYNLSLQVGGLDIQSIIEGKERDTYDLRGRIRKGQVAFAWFC